MKLVLVVVAAYVLLVGCMYAFQRSLMYFPSADMPEPSATRTPWFREVRYAAADGVPLLAWHAPARAADKPTVLLLHGNGGNLSHRAFGATPFHAAGYGVLLAAYRGYGGSPGQPSEAGLLADALGALDFLGRAGVPAERVVLLGESLGSGVAVALAAERRVAAVLLEAPFTSAGDVAQRAYPFVPARALIRDRFDSAARIARIGVPLLVVHGEADAVVPVDLGRRLFALAAEPKRGVFLPGAQHNDLLAHGLREIELAFLAEFVPAR